jgi:hypothetical protein
MVADVVAIESVSAWKFTANRKNAGNFAESGFTSDFQCRSAIKFSDFNGFPCAREQGNIFKEQGKNDARTGNIIAE